MWLNLQDMWADRTYVVFENERHTYAQMHERIVRLASLFYAGYGVRKGDRVAICMRNLPEFLVAFWATNLIGAVATMVNAWASPHVLLHCIGTADPTVLVVDPERADTLSSGSLLQSITRRATSLRKVLVVRSHEARPGAYSRWKGITDFEEALAAYSGPTDVWEQEPEASPDDDVTIFFTSGTSGVPKGVLSSQRGFMGNILNAAYNRQRALLRDGEELPPPDFVQKSYLISVPLFHVTGLTSHLVRSNACWLQPP